MPGKDLVSPNIIHIFQRLNQACDNLTQHLTQHHSQLPTLLPTVPYLSLQLNSKS